MDEAKTAGMLKALGEPSRLRIFQFLRECECICGEEDQEQTAGSVCCSVFGTDKVTSTLSFHLKELRLAGLIEMEKRGKYMVCRLNKDAAKELEHFFITPPNQIECGVRNENRKQYCAE